MVDLKKILIVGGAGFIGINAANHYLKKGYYVEIFDNLSREGSKQNVKWLEENNHSENLRITLGNIAKDYDKLRDCVGRVDYVLHLAAQVAVTSSVINPRDDFESNALGTFNLLEAIRNSDNKPPIIYSSTNKVYGEMKGLEIIEGNESYQYKDLAEGVSENVNLDFHSPYGCSKGCADQYVIDYSRIFGIKSIVMRQSCIYGYRQFGIEDQGWVAWFAIAALLDKPITIYGDGKQVRDILFIEDLINLFDIAFEKIDLISGGAYNIGGGPQNKISVLGVIKFLEKMFNKKISYKFSEWRPGDQKVYISDISKVKRDLGWEPKRGIGDGIMALCKWVKENRELFEK